MRNAQPRRGMHDMRTRTTRKSCHTLNSPELYIKLTSLEIEKSRRAIELETLMERVRKLTERIQSIADEQLELHSRLEVQPTDSFTLQSSPMRHDNSAGFTY